MHTIFLDQNKWIELARVYAGTVKSGPSCVAYEQLVSAVSANRIVCPLTISHIVETAKRHDPVSRSHVAEVQARLSKGHVFRSRKARLLIEMRNALHMAFGEEVVALPKNWAVVPGFRQSFEDYDMLVASPEAAAKTKLLNEHLDPAQQYIDYMLHQDDGRRRMALTAFEAESRALLGRIEARRTIMRGSTIDLRWRAYAAKLFLDNQGFVAHMLDVIGHNIDQMKSLGGEVIVEFIRNVPTLNVEAELTARLESQTGPLEVNDIRDMLSFYTAVPYAQRMVAEKGFVSLSRQAKLDIRYGVALSTKLEEVIGLYE